MVRQEQPSLTDAIYFDSTKQLNVTDSFSQANENSKKRMPKFSIDYDVAVIGSGIAGLTSAAYLAKEGLKVIVLERDVHPGGCAASFNHGPYQFAVGATVAMGFEPNGLHRNIYKDLGLTPEFVNVDPAIKVHLPDRTLSLFTNRDVWHAELERVFPINSKNILAFWKDVEAIASVMNRVSKHFPVMPFKHIEDVVDTLKGFHPNLITLLPLLRSTVFDLLKKHNLVSNDIETTMFKAFIDGQLLDAMQTTSDKCVLTSGAYALDIYRFGCQYKVGGLDTIAYDLCDYIESRGGTISFSTRVKSIVNQDGHIQGLVTNRGDISVPIVVSAVPLQNTADLLDDPTGSTLPTIAAKQDFGWGAFTLYLGVDEQVLNYSDTNSDATNSAPDIHYFEQISSPTSSTEHDVTNMLISISPSWDQTRAPKGQRAITISTHVDARAWLELAQTSKEVYTKAKRELENTIIDELSTIFPNIRSGIDVMLSGSPRTFKRFTLRADGLVGGFPQDLKHANFQAPSHRTDIKGLYLAGDTVFPGQGTLGTSVSGFNTARSATRFHKRNTRKTSQLSQVTASQTSSQSIN